jgi:riboflavin kinase / FMN adenylyltransferase
MQIEKELAACTPARDMLLTIGVFDGVHLGHRHLISRLKESAGRKKLLAGVVTFRDHPEEVLSRGPGLSFLTTLDQRVALLRAEGVDAVVTLSFTPELAGLTARQFISLLMNQMRMRGLVVGPDFALGRDREGDIPTLRRLGQEMGFSIDAVPPLKIGGDVVSSTAIRQALAKGEIERVEKLLGRPLSLRGSVVPGDKRGTGLGFPTANLGIGPEAALPPDGVYVTRADVAGKEYPSVTNIGTRPTFGGKGRTVEVFIIGYSGELYGREMAVDIIARLRGEQKFSSPEELKQQINRDIEQTKTILKDRGESHG